MLKVVMQIIMEDYYAPLQRHGTLAVVGQYSNHCVLYDQSSTVAAPVSTSE